MRPLLRGAIAAAVLSLAPVAVVTTTAAPASAMVDVATSSTLGNDFPRRGEFGEFISPSISGSVVAADGSSPTGGVQLQAQAPGSSTWRTVASSTFAPDPFFSDYTQFRSNTKLRLNYPGGTSGDTNYLPSVSSPISLKVFREIDFTNVSGKRQPTADLKISPKYKNKTILVQKKQGKKFKPFKKIKTNAKSKVRFSVPGSSRGTEYRLVIPNDKKFVATKLPFTATVF
jgi:hypothetical protein